MDNFQDTEDDTLVISEEELEEMAVSRTSTRRRKSTFNGLQPFSRGVLDLPPGTELYGPRGQRGYIAGHTPEGLVVFDLREGLGAELRHVTVEMRPEAFSDWRTSGGAAL